MRPMFQLYQCHLPTGKWQKIVTMGKKPKPMYGQVSCVLLLCPLCLLQSLSFVLALESCVLLNQSYHIVWLCYQFFISFCVLYTQAWIHTSFTFSCLVCQSFSFLIILESWVLCLLCSEDIAWNLWISKFMIVKTMEESSLVQVPVEKLTVFSNFIPCYLRIP